MTDRSDAGNGPGDEEGPGGVHLGPSHAAEAGPRWSAEAIERLASLAIEAVPAEVIAEAMHRPLPEVLAKAAELGLPLSSGDRRA